MADEKDSPAAVVQNPMQDGADGAGGGAAKSFSLVELLHARASVTSTTLGFSWGGPPAARACCAVLLTGNVLWSLVGTFMFISGLDHWKTPKAFAITSNITSDDPEYADSTGEESTGEQVLRLYFLVVVFLLLLSSGC